MTPIPQIMKISVIIPAFNEERRIADALKAVLAQDYLDFEVIVVDNGSSDRTAEIARSFPAVKAVTEPNKGTMWACEHGRREASGEIIVRMDADCLPDRDWLSKGARHFEDSRVVVVSGPYVYYDAGRIFRTASIFSQTVIFKAVHELLQLAHIGGITVGGNTFIRTSALRDAGGFDTGITFYGDDTDIPKRLSRFGACVYDTNLKLKTSSRRFKEEGVFALEARYIKYFFRVLFGKRKAV